LGIAADTPLQQAIVRQRFVSLKKQFPWVYAIFLVNLMGLHFVVVPEGYEGFDPTLIFVGVVAVRLVYWLRLGNRRISDERLQRELMRSCILSGLVCATFCAWMIFLSGVPSARNPASVITFANLTAVGVFYGLSSLPAAARAPIYFLSLPLALMLMTSQEPNHVVVGLSQSALILLMLRMLSVQDRAFVRLVSTRFAIETKRLSAVQGERSALEEQARFGVIANTDSLTGLQNRRALMTALGTEATHLGARALIIFDLDGFKPINDTFGHLAGDTLLVEVGERLRLTLPRPGLAARLGGDEFALLFEAGSPTEALEIAKQAVQALSEPFVLDSRIMSVSACAGVSWHERGQGANLMREADIALYSAKSRGRGLVDAFSIAMQEEIQRKTEIEQALRQPGLPEMIDLAFQPIFHLHTLELRAFEALARWEHSELGWISPAEFIPITEQISAIEELSEALLRRAATVALAWPASVRLSFNLSPIQLSSTGSGARVLAIIRELGFPADRLQVEVTETALLADFNVARDNLAVLRHAGTRIVLDDFGAGYASISYLREINFDAIKLDGSLVTAIGDSGLGLPILRGVVALCHAMGRQCIAEHIETAAQLRILRQLGCRYGQGFGLGLPIDGAAATNLARARVVDFAALRSSAA
jgi:diguanylate cyclase (GGDEF)-like protein